MEIKNFLIRIIKIGTVLVFLTPLVLGAYGLNMSEYPKAVFFRSLIEIIFVFYVWLIFLNPAYIPKKSILLFSIIFFDAVLIISSIFGINFYRSFFGEMQRGEGIITHLHLLAFFIILIGMFRKKEDWMLLFKSTVIISALSSIVAVLQKAGLVSFYGIEYRYRPSGTLSNPDLFGCYISLSIFLAFYLLLSAQKRGWKIFWLSLIALNFFTLILSGTRAAWVGFGFGIISIYILNYKDLNYKKRICSLLIVLFISALILFAPFIIEKLHLENNFLAIRISSMYDINAGFRLGLSEISFRAFKDRPVLGWGFETFSFVSDKYFRGGWQSTIYYDRPHVKLAEILTYGGAVGTISYFLLFFVIFYLILKHSSKQDGQDNKSKMVFASILFAFFTCYFVQDIFSFDNIGTYILFFLIAGFVNNNFPKLPDINLKNFAKPLSAVKVILIFDFAVLMAFVMYQVNIKPTIAAMYFPGSVIYESSDPQRALDGYKNGINMNTLYNNDLVLAYVDRSIFLLENGYGRNIGEKIIEGLLEVKPVLEKDIKEKDERPNNIYEFLARTDEWSYIVRKDPIYLDEMKNYLNQAIAFNSNIPVFYQLEGEMEIMQNKDNDGQKDIKKSCDIDTNGCNGNEAQLYRMIGIAYFKKGDYASAIKNFQNALDIDYNSRKKGLPSVISRGEQFADSVALMYYSYFKDFESCKKVYERAMEVYPGSKDIFMQHLNMITADYEKNKK